MQAIEFKTTLHNGVVTIPAEYSAQWEGKTIRVIVLDDAENLAQPVKQSQTLAFRTASLNTWGFKFNRQEANAR